MPASAWPSARRTRVKKSKISESSGPVFELSGAALDSLDGAHARLLLAWQPPPPATAPLTDALICLIDLQVTRWTAREALAVRGTMAGLTQTETSEFHSKLAGTVERPTQQAVAKALARSHWKSHLEPAIKNFTRMANHA